MSARDAVIGYYVHHHGEGHATRFRAIAAASDRRLVPISERTDLGDGVILPSDVPLVDTVDPTAGGALHWAPLDPRTAAPRLRSLVEWLETARPAGVVVDVSVEVTLACRLAGFATVCVRLHGPRSDRAHQLAHSTAAGLLAPYPPELEMDSCRDVLDKTFHAGFIHPIDTAATTSTSPRDNTVVPSSHDAVVVWGGGGGHLSGRAIDAVAASIDGTVYCAGHEIWAPGDGPCRSNVVDLGWVTNTSQLLVERPVVMSSAGNNCVAAAARARCPLIVVALPRPFDEQRTHATALAGAGVAVCAPETTDSAAWREAVAGARAAARSWDRLRPQLDGAAAAAGAIDEWLSP